MTDFIPSKFCPGCGYPIVLNILKLVLERMQLIPQAVLGLDIGCNLLAWNYLPVNTFQTHHGRAVPTMVGFKRARPAAVCFALVGDGGAYAIGLQSLLHAAKRDEAITVLVVNNTVYGMTGGQTAPTSLPGQSTDTYPHGSQAEPWFGPELIRQVAHEKAFLARTAVNDSKQFSSFIEAAITTQRQGHFALVEILSLCPTNWKTTGMATLRYLDETLKPAFPLGEVERS